MDSQQGLLRLLASSLRCDSCALTLDYIHVDAEALFNMDFSWDLLKGSLQAKGAGSESCTDILQVPLQEL